MEKRVASSECRKDQESLGLSRQETGVCERQFVDSKELVVPLLRE